MKLHKTVPELLIIQLLLWCVSVKAASKGGPKIGDTAPLSPANSLLQAPPGARLDVESLRGKVVVLEFWATWCGPCVAAISHLNELADRFKNDPVQFVAITAETESVIKPFLKKRPVKAWVALDTDRAMNNTYGVVAIPHTVLLDKQGRIAAIIHPQALTAESIEDLLAGRKIALKESAVEEATVENKEEKRPLFEVSVRPSIYTNSSGGGGGGEFTAHGYTIWDLLPRAFDLPYNSTARLLTNATLPEGKYDFIVVQTPVSGRDRNALEKNVSPLLQQILISTFGLTSHRETKEVAVFLLKVANSHAPGLVVSPTPGGSSRAGPGIIEGINLSMGALAEAVERCLNQPVFDETGLTNNYDISLKWEQDSVDKPNLQGLRQELWDRLGLELVQAKRRVEMVVIEHPEIGGQSRQ